STYDSLRTLQLSYYDRARFADVFVVLKRAPLAVENRLLAIPGVAAAETTVGYDVLLDVPDVIEPVTGRMIALSDGGNPAINRLTLMAGRWIAAPASNEVLVNEAFARARSLRPGDHIVALLNGKREPLHIVGIVLSPEYIFGGRGVLADEKSFGVFWMGRKRLAAAYNMEGAFNRIAVRLAHGASEQAVIDALDRLFDPYGSTGAHGRDEQFSHRALTQEINEQRVFGIVLPSVFLAVAIFLLNVVLTRQIGTQRSQIAALKALGYRDALIGVHYLKFVLVIVVLGIAIGLAIGAWLGRLMTEMYAVFFRFPTLDYRLQTWIVLVASGTTLCGAVLGALHALVGVVRLPPAVAMQPASPPSYRPTLLEVLGYGQVYSQHTRMILRNIERQPLRSFLTLFAIACSVAILISGTWWRDAIDYLLDVEFRLRERQHVSLVFTDPVSSSAIYELSRLPGVLKVEAGREAQVRFRNGHRAYRTTLIGLPPDSEMRKLLDDRLHEVKLVPGGVVLSERLARRIDARRGDTVRVEFLQGERAKKEIHVAGI
ncbi:MAG TPA: FtsX-like permease family protein, partial [Burkholderiales bacterium]|nr:FtsX-like permease family protein [Burkholderiales bacterium]